MVRSFSQVQKIVSVSCLLTDLAFILFTACKFLIIKDCLQLYRFDRYEGASTYA